MHFSRTHLVKNPTPHRSTCCSSRREAGPDISQLTLAVQNQWNHSKNAHLGSITITPHSSKKVWWECDQCPDGQPHVWETTVGCRTCGANCPFCTNRKVCQHNSLLTKAPAIAAEFSPKNQGTAHDYTVSSTKVVTWQCQHQHEWETPINRRTSGKKGCPVCFSIRNSTQTRTRHPFLTDSQHPMMHNWDWGLNAKAGFSPDNIRCRSSRKVNWICHNCPKGQPHRWQATVSSVYQGTGCPCCFGSKVCTCNSLQTLFPDVAAEWDYTKNESTPSDTTARTNERVWWHNSKRGHFEATIVSQTTNAKAKKIRAADHQTDLPQVNPSVLTCIVSVAAAAYSLEQYADFCLHTL